MRSLRRKLIIAFGVLAVAWLELSLHLFTSPLVVLHYSAAATAPVGYFFNEDNTIHKSQLEPGATRGFRTKRWPGPDYYLDVSFPAGGHDDVELKPPFSRVDIYIRADTRIVRTVVDQRLWTRFSPP